MALTRFNTQQDWGFGYKPFSRAFTVDANGGQVVIESASADDAGNIEWTVTDTLTEDSGNILDTAGYRLRFTPTGGATFAIDLTEGES